MQHLSSPLAPLSALALALAVALGCAARVSPSASEPTASECPETAPRPTSLSADDSAEASAQPADVPEETAVEVTQEGPHPPCERPLLWLSEYAFDRVEPAFCQRCGCDEGGMLWSLARGPEGRSECNEIEGASLAIAAYLGVPVEHPRFAPYFEHQRWYQPQDGLRVEDLPEVARTNIERFRRAHESCRQARPQVSAAQQGAIDAWFAARTRGEVRLPATLMEQCAPVDRAHMGELLGRRSMLRYGPSTPVDILESECLGGPGRTVVAASTGSPGLDCRGDDEACEGYEALLFAFDRRGRIVGLGFEMAACPAIYVIGEDGVPRPQGELLRSLLGEARAGAQALALDVGESCPASLRIRLVEELRETAHVDALWLTVDGATIRPQGCDGPHCREDGHEALVRQGESLEVEFMLPRGASCGDLRLHARGYYVH